MVPDEVLCSDRIGWVTKALYASIARHADRSGVCKEPLATLAKHIGMDKSNAFRSKKVLLKEGFVVRGLAAKGRGATPELILPYHPGRVAKATKGITMTPLKGCHGDTPSPLKGITMTTERVSQGYPSEGALPLRDIQEDNTEPPLPPRGGNGVGSRNGATALQPPASAGPAQRNLPNVEPPPRRANRKKSTRKARTNGLPNPDLFEKAFLLAREANQVPISGNRHKRGASETEWAAKCKDREIAERCFACWELLVASARRDDSWKWLGKFQTFLEDGDFKRLETLEDLQSAAKPAQKARKFAQ